MYCVTSEKSQNRRAMMTRPHYAAVTFIKNRLDAPLKADDRVVATGGDLQKIEQAGTFGYVPVGGSRRECYQR